MTRSIDHHDWNLSKWRRVCRDCGAVLDDDLDPRSVTLPCYPGNCNAEYEHDIVSHAGGGECVHCTANFGAPNPADPARTHTG